MIRFAARRLLVAVVQVMLVTLIAYLLFFVVASVTGATPAQRMAGHAATPAQIARVSHVIGTDRPWYAQYFHFLGNVVQGNFGYSFNQRRPVSDIIFPAASVTSSLVLFTVILWLLIAIPVGLVGALRPRSVQDRILSVLIQLAIAAPVFWVAPMFSYLFGFQPSQGRFLGIPLWGSVSWLPIQGYVSFTHDPIEWAHHLVLPGLALALGFAAIYARFVRALVLEQLGEEYVLVARAKGATEAKIIRSHITPVVAPLIVTLLGLDIGATLSGVLFVEQVFGLPGLGYAAFNSIQNLDYPLTMGSITLAGLMAVAANTIADLGQAVLDPRIRSA